MTGTPKSKCIQQQKQKTKTDNPFSHTRTHARTHARTHTQDRNSVCVYTKRPSFVFMRRGVGELRLTVGWLVYFLPVYLFMYVFTVLFRQSANWFVGWLIWFVWQSVVWLPKDIRFPSTLNNSIWAPSKILVSIKAEAILTFCLSKEQTYQT